MLILQEFIDGKLTRKEEIDLVDLSEDGFTFGRASYASCQIGKDFHPAIQRAISRVQATVKRDERDRRSLRIFDGKGDRSEPSATGIWSGSVRIVNGVNLKRGQPITLFRWQRQGEPVEARSMESRNSAWNSVQIEVSLIDDGDISEGDRETIGADADWNDVFGQIEKTNNQIEQTNLEVQALRQTVEELKASLTGIDSKIEQHVAKVVNTQFKELKDKLDLKIVTDGRQSKEIARLNRQTRGIVITIAIALCVFVMFGSIKNVSDGERDQWFSLLRDVVTIGLLGSGVAISSNQKAK